MDNLLPEGTNAADKASTPTDSVLRPARAKSYAVFSKGFLRGSRVYLSKSRAVIIASPFNHEIQLIQRFSKNTSSGTPYKNAKN